MNTQNEMNLHVAIMNADTDLVEKIIRDKTVNLDEHDLQGFTALHLASQKRNIEIVKLLLDNGANPNLTDVYGNTPLWRSLGGDDECNILIRIFLDAGVNPSHKNDSGVSVIDHVSKIKTHPNRKLFFD